MVRRLLLAGCGGRLFLRALGLRAGLPVGLPVGLDVRLVFL